MSQLNVDTIEARTNNSITLGGTSDTITIPAGATITNSGTANGFGGGAWTLIGTQVASSSASLTQTGLDSTYDCYVVVISDILPENDAVNPRLRFGNSGGIISTANTYSYHLGRQWDNSGSPYQGVHSRDTQNMILIGHNIGNASGEGFHAVLYIYGNQGGTTKPMVMINSMQLDDHGHMGFNSGAGNHDNAITLDRFQFYLSSGNITSGKMRTYGIQH